MGWAQGYSELQIYKTIDYSLGNVLKTTTKYTVDVHLETICHHHLSHFNQTACNH